MNTNNVFHCAYTNAQYYSRGRKFNIYTIICFNKFLASIKQIFSQLCAAEPNTGKHGQRLLKFYYSFMPRSSNQQANYLDKIEQFSTISKV